MVGAVQATR